MLHIKSLKLNNSTTKIDRVNLFFDDITQGANALLSSMVKALRYLLGLKENNWRTYEDIQGDLVIDLYSNSPLLGDTISIEGSFNSETSYSLIEFRINNLTLRFINNSYLIVINENESYKNIWDNLVLFKDNLNIFLFNKFRERDIEESNLLDSPLEYYSSILNINKSSNGIVFIHEIERYIPIKYQSEILHLLINNFPNHQFFITTQSPYVIGDYNRSTILVKDELEEYKGYGKLYSQINRDLLNFNEREIYINSHFNSLNYYIENEKWDKARVLYDFICSKVEHNDPFLVKAKSLINPLNKDLW
jgi:hypothetical protein